MGGDEAGTDCQGDASKDAHTCSSAKLDDRLDTRLKMEYLVPTNVYSG